MTLHKKVDGEWVQAARPYVKRNGVWVACEQAWVRRSGAWVQAYNQSITPPNPPLITLSVVEDFDTIKGVKTLITRYIKVGVRLPGSTNDPNARLVRVLTNYNGKPPTTPLGATWTQEPDKTYPNEPWSEWRYNDFGGHKDTSVEVFKQWEPNMTAGQIIKSDKTYYFTGWSTEDGQVWSAATAASINIPKAGVEVPNVVTKEARFQPNTSGSWRSAGFQSGNLVQQRSPRSKGLWFYGNQFTDGIGTSGTPTVKHAQIFIRREADSGAANANVYLFWNGYGSVGALPDPSDPGGITRHDVTKLGQLAKGQGKWFDLPDAFFANLNSDIKGMGLDYKDPVKADAFADDYSSVTSTAAAVRCGEVHVVWEEQL